MAQVRGRLCGRVFKVQCFDNPLVICQWPTRWRNRFLWGCMHGVRKSDPDSDWFEHAIGVGQALHTLCAYSLYCGTGHQITMGMSQARLDKS
jgi:hypothetical protein